MKEKEPSRLERLECVHNHAKGLKIEMMARVKSGMCSHKGRQWQPLGTSGFKETRKKVKLETQISKSYCGRLWLSFTIPYSRELWRTLEKQSLCLLMRLERASLATLGVPNESENPEGRKYITAATWNSIEWLNPHTWMKGASELGSPWLGGNRGGIWRLQGDWELGMGKLYMDDRALTQSHRIPLMDGHSYHSDPVMLSSLKILKTARQLANSQ